MNTTLESVIVALPKHLIEFDLEQFGQDVVVVASRMTEDGYELVLEGDAGQVADLIYLWGCDEDPGF